MRKSEVVKEDRETLEPLEGLSRGGQEGDRQRYRDLTAGAEKEHAATLFPQNNVLIRPWQTVFGR